MSFRRVLAITGLAVLLIGLGTSETVASPDYVLHDYTVSIGDWSLGFRDYGGLSLSPDDEISRSAVLVGHGEWNVVFTASQGRLGAALILLLLGLMSVLYVTLRTPTRGRPSAESSAP